MSISEMMVIIPNSSHLLSSEIRIMIIITAITDITIAALQKDKLKKNGVIDPCRYLRGEFKRGNSDMPNIDFPIIIIVNQ